MCIKEKNIFKADRWEELFNRLLILRENNGHCWVPANYEQDLELGAWVAAQRLEYGSGSSSSHRSLTRERRKRLVKINFEGEAKPPRCVPWETRFRQLLEFVVHNGHAHVPIGWKANVPLSNWVSAQRQDFKSMQKGCEPARLDKNRIFLLNSVGFIWNAQRGGRKRLEKDGRVPPPMSHETTEAVSSAHQMQAKKLLQVFHESDNGQINVIDSLETTPANQRQGVLTGQRIECEEELRSSLKEEFKDNGMPFENVQAIGVGKWNWNHLIQTATPGDVDDLDVNNIAQIKFTRQILDPLLPNVAVPSQMQTTPCQALDVNTIVHPLLNPSGLVAPVEALSPLTAQLPSHGQSELHLIPSLCQLQLLPSMVSQVLLTCPNLNSVTASRNADLTLTSPSTLQSKDPFGAMHHSDLLNSCSSAESSINRKRSADSLGCLQYELDKKLPAKNPRK